MTLSIIIPAKNEADGLQSILPTLCRLYPKAEILVVDDGSTDSTSEVLAQFPVKVVRHPYSQGNGSAIKSGLRVATGEYVVCMDADGQHRPEDIQELLDKLGQGYDMVVGARMHHQQAGVHRSLGNAFYNWFATQMVGHVVQDLTSGFRAVKTRRFREFINILPNRFSYPTTVTMSFFRAGYPIAYVPVNVKSRMAGTKSHIRLWKDGLRFLIIIFKVATLYSPLKVFLPISAFFFVTGLSYYLFTYLTLNRFTNMSMLLFTTSIMIFLMGLISEQITTLIYKDNQKSD